VLRPDSTLDVPEGLGIGVDVVRERLEQAVQRWHDHYPYI
jgi:hypothetical protein